MYRFISLLAIFMALFVSNVIADENASDSQEIVITEGSKKTITEYQANGAVYAIKVAPKEGEPYYLVPSSSTNKEGDSGFIRTTGHEMLIPSWKLFEWK